MWLGSEGKVLKSDARILSAIRYAAEASIYPPHYTAGELTSAQMILLSFVYALKHRDLQLIEILVEASSTVPQINSSFLSVWLRDDFRFPRGDVVTWLSILGKLLLDGLQVPWALVATLASLDIKYRVQESFLEGDDTAGQLLISTMNPYVSQATQASCDKVLQSKESQTNLTKHVSFKLDVEKTSTGTQVELILHDRGISVKPEQSTTGVQSIPEQKPMKDQVLMIGDGNGAQTTPIIADWSHLVLPTPKQKPMNDQVLMIGNGNGAQTTSINASWSLLGVQPIPKTANDSGLRTSQENEKVLQHISVNPFGSVPNNQKEKSLAIIDPSTGMDILEDYHLDKSIFFKKDPAETPKTYRVSNYSSNPNEKDRPSSSKASTLTKDPTARVKDGTKTLTNKAGLFLKKEWPNSKGMANEQMYSAILNNDTKSIITAINAGADVNDEGVMKKRPLHVASSAGRLEPVIELIHWGADVNSLDSWGETPLFVASVAGHLLMAEVLVAAGADIHHKNNDGNSPLHVAASAGQLEVIRLLLTSGAELDCRGQWLRTPLHCAASGGHLSVVALLLDQGACPIAVDATGNTPFSLAKSNQQTLVSEFLLYRSRQ